MILTLLASVVGADEIGEELPDPGITPDSPLYFLDQLFDNLQSPADVANEKAAEIVAMANKGKEKALDKAVAGYQKALERRQKKAETDESEAEGLAKQTSNHILVLARVLEKAPEAARKGLENAMEKSMQNRDKSLKALEKTNKEKADKIRAETKAAVLERVPEQAKAKVEAAFGKAAEGMPEDVGAPEDKGKPEDIGAPEDIGKPAGKGKPAN